MTTLEIITVLIILVIVAQIVLNSKKNNAEKDVSASPAKFQDKVTQPSEPKPTANSESEIKPQSSVTHSSHKPVAATIEASTTGNNSLLPQDSILRRHYLTHLCNIVESLAPQRPTDSVLSRHYDAMLVAKLVQCSTNEKALAQLFHDYENNTPDAIVPPLTEPQAELTKIVATEDNSSPLPQDSVQRRHYLAHLISMIESLTSPRPTDSVLIRHYEAILAANLVQCLTNNESMKQLLDNYEGQK
jgi:hypothetical protein